MVGEVQCLACRHTERRALDLVEIATTPGACSACGSRALDYQFNVFHWSRITERLSVGGRIPDRAAMAQLHEDGITHMVSVAPEADAAPLAAAVGMQYLMNGCDDDYDPKPPEFLDAAVSFVLQALELPGSKVHVHCAAGTRRSIMVMLAVLRCLGHSQAEAMRLLTERRATAQFVPAYLESVEAYIRWRAK